MVCRICSQDIVNRGLGSPLYCTDCNAQIALAAERLTKNNSRRRGPEIPTKRVDL